MKTQTLFKIIFTAVTFIGCSSNSSSDKSLLNDAKKVADLDCRYKQLLKTANTAGYASIMEEDIRISEESGLLKKKYKLNDELYLKFLDAVSNEMLNCKIQDEPANDDQETEVTTQSDNEDWDQMLDDYEAYVTEYVTLYKKAMKGDGDALTAYPELLEKAENLQNSMQEAEKNKSLSGSQLKRMAKIQSKMLEALQSN